MFRGGNIRKSGELEILSEPALRQLRIAKIKEDEITRKAQTIKQRWENAIDQRVKDIEQRDEADRQWLEGLNRKGVSVRSIIEHVCAAYMVKPHLVIGESRRSMHCLARHVIMYLCRELTLKSTTEIGRFLCNRDHSTVVHGAQRIKRIVEVDREFRNRIELMKAYLQTAV